MTLDEKVELALQNLTDTMNGVKTEYSIERITNYMNDKFSKDIQKPIKRGLDETLFPTLYWKEGGEVGLEYVRFIFLANKNYEYHASHIRTECNAIFEKIDKQSGEKFASYILDLIQSNGGFVKKNKYLFVPMTYLGGDDVITAIRDKVVKTNRAALVKLLGINGSMKAARALAEMPKNFKNKQGAVVTSCKENFAIIAYKMGMTVTDLQDEMIPDFGFVDLYYPFETAKGQHFRAFLANDFKIRFLDENDKIRKSVPAQTPDELKLKFKGIAKEVRALVKQQKLTLEQAMITQRRWKKAAWDKHFMNKPLMFAFVQTLVWATFDENGAVLQTFMVAQDGTLEDTEYEEIELDETAIIGLIHPIQLEENVIESWTVYMNDGKLKTHFDQLNRKVNYVDNEIFDDKMLSKFEEKACPNIVGRSEKRGWSRGSIVDAGGVSFYMKSFENARVDVIVQTEGLSIGYNYDCVFGKLYFVKHGSVQVGSYTYDEPDNNKDNRLISVKNISKIIYSEVINDMEFFIG